MAKASIDLGMSQSAVSQAIAALEDALGVPLLDRTSRGVEPTLYGAALVRRGEAAFDELRSGIKDIESLADPATGEVRIACTAPMAAGILPTVIDRFSQQFPRITLQVIETNTYEVGYATLEQRIADLVLTLSPKPFELDLSEHLQAEVLFSDRICLAASPESPWARRRRLHLRDLVGAPMVAPAFDTPGGTAIIRAFRAAGLDEPQVTVTTFSVHVRTILSMKGRFISVLPASILRFNPGLYALEELPFELPMPHWPASLVILKNRTLSPPVENFITCAREVAKSTVSKPRPRNL